MARRRTDDSARRLGGLIKDLMDRFRSGQITLDQLDWYVHLPKEVRDRLVEYVYQITKK